MLAVWTHFSLPDSGRIHIAACVFIRYAGMPGNCRGIFKKRKV